MIDFNEIKILKELGAGMVGTTYLAEYKHKQYALKIQHILEEDKIKDFKNEMWRELDLYEYINNLDKEEQLFFTRLHEYKIYNDCKHIQKRPFALKANNEFHNKLKKLDESDWCVKYLLDYKGNMTLHKFLSTKKLTEQQIYSLMLQICKIIYTLYKGGYAHGDLHPQNIMITKTTKKYFNFMDKKIPYCEYQLSAIDFGNVIHKKFNIKYSGSKSLFLIDSERYMFREIFDRTYHVIDNFSKNWEIYKKKKTKMPWEKKSNIVDYIRKKILLKHPDFVTMAKFKYFKSFPKAEKIFNKLIEELHNKKNKTKYINDIIKEITDNNLSDIHYFLNLIIRLVFEFDLFFPETYSKYAGWISYFENPLPKNIVLDLLTINNYKDYIDYLIKKIEK